MKTKGDGKYVYLFELDSVRKTDKEIAQGLKELYNEITWNGNVVVLTFNQLVDSRAFFSLLADERHYDNFVSLFENGAIRISQYSDIRTISQYLLNSLESKKSFVYSGWPLKSTQGELVKLIRDSLTYSDLSKINDWIIAGKKYNQKVKDLFIEEIDNTTVPSGFSVELCTEILVQLYGLIKTVLRLSEMHDIYIAPKEQKSNSKRQLFDFLGFIDSLEISDVDFANIVQVLDKTSYLDKEERRVLKSFNPAAALDRFQKAISLIKETRCFNEKSICRSDYVDELFAKFNDENDHPKLDKAIYQLAEAIVKLACNYAYEASICNVSKHYSENELDSTNNEKWSFKCDFLARLVRYFWLMGDWDKRFLCDNADTFKEYTILPPDFCRSVRFAKYVNRRDELIEAPEKVSSRYESNLVKGALLYKVSIAWKLFCNCFCILMLFGVAALIEVVFDCLGTIFQNLQNCLPVVVAQHLQTFHDWALSLFFVQKLHHWMPWLSRGWFHLIFFIIATQFVTKLIKKMFKAFLSLSEAVEKLWNFLCDFFVVAAAILFKHRRPRTYSNSAGIKRIPQHGFIRSQALKEYRKLLGDTKMASLFAPSAVYPLAISKSEMQDDGDVSIMSELSRLEKRYGYRFGVVYESEYNRIVVDPVKNANGEYFPYERVIPKAGNGVVALTVCKGKFVLLRQYRHAPRTEILSFPRGFTEENLMDKDNVAKELNEELLVQPSDIVSTEMLGKVFPDSGILATCASVWLVTISRYEAEKGHEGILDAVELDEDQFCNYIRDGKITDGFTLAAYVLYKTHRSNR